jgi:signal peptidase II
MSEFANEERRGDARIWIVLITMVVIAADRLSKLWIKHHIAIGNARTIIPNVFRLTHVLNTGAAFSLFEQTKDPELVRKLLIGFSIVAALVIVVLIWRMGRRLTLGGVALAMILGGAIGNLYDRLVHHYVTDFLEVKIVHYHWPDFNVADSAIVVGACLLFIEILWPQRES